MLKFSHLKTLIQQPKKNKPYRFYFPFLPKTESIFCDIRSSLASKSDFTELISPFKSDFTELMSPFKSVFTEVMSPFKSDLTVASSALNILFSYRLIT